MLLMDSSGQGMYEDEIEAKDSLTEQLCYVAMKWEMKKDQENARRL